MSTPIDPHVSPAACASARASAQPAVAIGCRSRGEVSLSLFLCLSPFPSLSAAALSRLWHLRQAWSSQSRSTFESGAAVASCVPRRIISRERLVAFRLVWCVIYVCARAARPLKSPLLILRERNFARDARPSESENAATHGRLVNSVNHRHHPAPGSRGTHAVRRAFCVSLSFSLSLSLSLSLSPPVRRARARAYSRHSPIPYYSVYLSCENNPRIPRVHHLRSER